jgi:hypothetical protein
VVVDDLDICGAAVRPDEADSKLIVDPDRILSLAIAGQSFEAIAWRRSQIAQVGSRI